MAVIFTNVSQPVVDVETIAVVENKLSFEGVVSIKDDEVGTRVLTNRFDFSNDVEEDKLVDRSITVGVYADEESVDGFKTDHDVVVTTTVESWNADLVGGELDVLFEEVNPQVVTFFPDDQYQEEITQAQEHFAQTRDLVQASIADICKAMEEDEENISKTEEEDNDNSEDSSDD